MGKDVEVNVPTALAELKEAIKDIIHEDALFEDDFYLLRWLKATKFNVKKAEKKLRKTGKWRKEIDMATLSKETFPDKLMDDVPIFVDTVTKDGAAVASLQAGLMDIPRLFKEWGREKLVRHLMQAFGQAESVLLFLDHRKYDGQPLTENSVNGAVFLIDADKLSAKDMSSLDVIQTVTEVCKKLKKYFPLLACKLIAVNCTPVVDVVLKIARTILEKANLKFEIYGKEEKSKWHEALQAQIPVHLLRENFGGTRPKSDDDKRVNYIDKDQIIPLLEELKL
ncbi:unnamed protein product [Allacma fusca]|uniref:CRAL-TRIO domain-containing protein n=5 Tax=Allacma fusca TaxID=39272 RepID=A0A8J2K2B8_9HEXA|nr:unnamed protein product [Allacma fusca]